MLLTLFSERKPRPMLRLLFRLWWTQKRRAFTWREAFVWSYMTVMFALMSVAVVMGLRAQMERLDLYVDAFVVLLVYSFTLPDLMLKLFWLKTPVVMDAALATRPLRRNTWHRFVLLVQLAQPLTWLQPALFAVLGLALGLSGSAWLMGMALMIGMSFVNDLLLCAWHRAPGNAQTLPLAFAYIVYLALGLLCAVLSLLFSDAFVLLMADAASGEDIPLMPQWPLAAHGAAYAAVVGLAGFFYAKMPTYFPPLRSEEGSVHASTTAVRPASNGLSFSHTHQGRGLLTQGLSARCAWLVYWRSPRLRTSFLLFSVVFLLNTYMQQMGEVRGDFPVNMMLLFGVCFPALMQAQTLLGVEANFFHGIWTRPWPLESVLRQKFFIFCLMCLLMAVLLLPAVVWMSLPLLTLVAVTLFSCGFIVPLMMPSCLFTSRMDLYGSAFFKHESANKQFHIFSFVLFIPLIIYFVAYYLLPTLFADVLLAALGVIGLILHRPFLRWLTRTWIKRRHRVMEDWMRN